MHVLVGPVILIWSGHGLVRFGFEGMVRFDVVSKNFGLVSKNFGLVSKNFAFVSKNFGLVLKNFGLVCSWLWFVS